MFHLQPNPGRFRYLSFSSQADGTLLLHKIVMKADRVGLWVQQHLAVLIFRATSMGFSLF